jgi:hypothetical protein
LEVIINHQEIKNKREEIDPYRVSIPPLAPFSDDSLTLEKARGNPKDKDAYQPDFYRTKI